MRGEVEGGGGDALNWLDCAFLSGCLHAVPTARVNCILRCSQVVQQHDTGTLAFLYLLGLLRLDDPSPCGWSEAASFGLWRSFPPCRLSPESSDSG